MKKYLNIAFAYAIAAMVGGVFYREFTKYSGFTGVTALGKVHAHLFLLGMLVFLVVALYGAHNDLGKLKTFRAFLWDLQHRRTADGHHSGGTRRSPGAGTGALCRCQRLDFRDCGHRPYFDRSWHHFAAAVLQKAGKELKTDL